MGTIQNVLVGNILQTKKNDLALTLYFYTSSNELNFIKNEANQRYSP